MARAARGEEIVVTRRGRPYVRIVAATMSRQAGDSYPLRGSVLRMADDFDTPLDEIWKALEG
jgi:antitoxin (DNA-binding transcriptional repressor) of toxin-antitoxin stability system